MLCIFLTLNRIQICRRPVVPRHRKPIRIIHDLVHMLSGIPKASVIGFQNICEKIHDFYIPERRISSGHDISDGGLITAMLEMAFAGNCGINVNLEFDQGGREQAP